MKWHPPSAQRHPAAPLGTSAAHFARVASTCLASPSSFISFSPRNLCLKKILASPAQCIIDELCSGIYCSALRQTHLPLQPLLWEHRQQAYPAESKGPQPKARTLEVLVSSGGLTRENSKLLLALGNSNRTV